MFKKTLLTTASVVVATCGAMTMAHAGELKLRLTDVNANNTPDPTATMHYDIDIGNDVNGSAGVNPGAITESRSIDKGFVGVEKVIDGDVFEFKHVVLADERMGGVDNPVGGFYEIDIFEVTQGASFGSTARFDIKLGGTADPWFKANMNCNEAIRAGTDNVHSISASTANGGQRILDGENEANCFVTLQEGQAGLVPDTAVGWLLPIETKACGDLVVSVTVTRQQGLDELVTETSHTIATCDDSLKAGFGGTTVKIDYKENFRSFLIPEEVPGSKVDFHYATLWAHVGYMHVDIHHFLVALKDVAKDVHDNVFDVSDIAGYKLVLDFDDLTGISHVELYRPGRWETATLDRVGNTATFELNAQDVRDQFCLQTWPGSDPERDADYRDKGDKDAGCSNYIKIHAFGPLSDNPYNGPIDHQDIVVAQSDFYLTPDNCTGDHCVKFFTPETEGVGSVVGTLRKTGIIFGAFDWVADTNSAVKSWFRLTGVPAIETLPNGELKGTITVENSSAGNNGEFKVDYTSLVSNGEVLLSMNTITNLLTDAGMADAANYGRADLTFTFYVDGDRGINMDMDRLLLTNGVFASYGDNSNDAFSLKARSCDDGRFGSHVANKLDPRFQHFLVSVCGAGELSRRGIYYYNP